MKTQLLSMLLIFCGVSINAQFASPVEISAFDTQSIDSADIDGDGNVDIVYHNLGNGNLVWRDNIDGNAIFGEERIIQYNISARAYIYIVDLNGDGNLDILMGTEVDGKVSWYENLDGAGNFGPRQIIATDVPGASNVFASDLDGDGQLDVLVVASIGNFASWYKNLDGNTFGPAQYFSTDLVTPVSIKTADIDGDGDLDVIVGGGQGNPVVLFENLDGLGTFGPKQIIGSETVSYQILTFDMDGDGDIDLFNAADIGKLVWYENTDGLGNFGPEILIANASRNLNIRWADYADIDNDGDFDVIAISWYGQLTWYENMDGLGTFGPQIFIAAVPWYGGLVTAKDFNGDGYVDLVAATGGNILYFENISYLGISDLSMGSISVYPNPVKDILNIDIQKTSEVKSIKLFDLLGKKLMEVNGYIENLDTSGLSAGMFFIKIETENGIFSTKIIKN